MSFIISFNVFDFLSGLMILFIIIWTIVFGANIGSSMSNKWLYYKNQHLKEKIKELEEELENN